MKLHMFFFVGVFLFWWMLYPFYFHFVRFCCPTTVMGATCAKNAADGNIAHTSGISRSSRWRSRSGRRSRMVAQSELHIQRCGTSSAVALSGPDAFSHARKEPLQEQDDVLSIPSVSLGTTLNAQALENVETTRSSAYNTKTKPIVTGATAATTGMGESAVNDDKKRGPKGCCRQRAPVFKELAAEPESTALCMNGKSNSPPPPSSRVNDKFAATRLGSTTTTTTTTTENYTECPVVGPSAVVSMKRKYSVSFSHTSALFTCISCQEEKPTDAPSSHSPSSALDAPRDVEAGSQGQQRSLLPTLIPKNVTVQPDGDNNSKTEMEQQKEEDEEHDKITTEKETLIRDVMSGRALIEKEEWDVREAILYSYTMGRDFPRQLDEEVADTGALGVASASQRMSHPDDDRSAQTSSLFTFSSIGEEFFMHTELGLLRPPVVAANVIEENSTLSFVVSSHGKRTDEASQGSTSHQNSIQLPRWERSGLLSPPPPPPKHNSTMIINIMSHDDNDVNLNTHIGVQVRAERFFGEGAYYEPGDNERKAQVMGLRAGHKEVSQLRVLRSPSLMCPRDGYFNAAEMDGKYGKPSCKLSVSAREFREGLLVSPSPIQSNLPDLCGAHYQRYGASLHTKSLTSLDASGVEATGTAQQKVAPCRRGRLIPPPPPPPPPSSSLSRRVEDAERDSRGSSRQMCRRSYTSPQPERCNGSVSSFGYLYSPRAEPVLSTTCKVASGAVAGMATTAIRCEGFEKKSAKRFCRWCDKPYEYREVCAVAGESHAVLRLRRKHEKEVKKRAQGLLRCGRIREAISELKAAGII
ncbi:hypothetical protein MOQ_001681 [Trypanosoma cruzi marinkellei]|uniref:Uncharacterized protein n=1 Tax=Trypanosoma cruzi marinkellei TaxID=85056 RepID=K2MS82_TRYCR|nr:hypothetical protein MOQ_001681 [Trypanosoma cruzi marinkellei]